jgi:hypothetical protein
LLNKRKMPFSSSVVWFRGTEVSTEHIEELVPEALFLGGLAPSAGPVMRELNGAVADFIP